MPIHAGLMKQDAKSRVAGLALRAARERIFALEQTTSLHPNNMPRNLYSRLSGMICWDSAMMCAWLGGGVNLEPPPRMTDIEYGVYHHTTRSFALVSTYSYNNLFTYNLRIDSLAQAWAMELGSFIGFVGPQGELKHVMLYCGNGLAAGSNNTCIFGPTPGGGWECLDLRNFFGGKQFTSYGVQMIYTPLWGQTIRRSA
jgi:hypothetical protein